MLLDFHNYNLDKEDLGEIIRYLKDLGSIEFAGSESKNSIEEVIGILESKLRRSGALIDTKNLKNGPLPYVDSDMESMSFFGGEKKSEFYLTTEELVENLISEPHPTKLRINFLNLQVLEYSICELNIFGQYLSIKNEHKEEVLVPIAYGNITETDDEVVISNDNTTYTLVW